MIVKRIQSAILLSELFLILPGVSFGGDEPKENKPMLIVPAPQNVTIDGDLKEWNKEGKIGPNTFDPEVADEYNATVFAMYDKDALYLAAIVVQPHPPYNTFPNKGVGAWNADDLIIRMTSDPALGTPPKISLSDAAASRDIFTANFWWNHTEKKTYCDGHYGMDGTVKLDKKETDEIKVAIKTSFDSKGYTAEIKVPWKVINPAFHPKAGDKISFTWEVSLGSNNMAEPTRMFQIFANGGSAKSFIEPTDWGTAMFK